MNFGLRIALCGPSSSGRVDENIAAQNPIEMAVMKNFSVFLLLWEMIGMIQPLGASELLF
jgi:hypothetical protein